MTTEDDTDDAWAGKGDADPGGGEAGAVRFAAAMPDPAGARWDAAMSIPIPTVGVKPPASLDIAVRRLTAIANRRSLLLN